MVTKQISDHPRSADASAAARRIKPKLIDKQWKEGNDDSAAAVPRNAARIASRVPCSGTPDKNRTFAITENLRHSEMYAAMRLPQPFPASFAVFWRPTESLRAQRMWLRNRFFRGLLIEQLCAREDPLLMIAASPTIASRACQRTVIVRHTSDDFPLRFHFTIQTCVTSIRRVKIDPIMFGENR